MFQNLTIDQIKQRATPVLQKSGIKRASLFGSFVRGEQMETSDIDFLIEYPNRTNLFDTVELKQNLEEVLGRSVDLVDYKSIKPRIKQQILSEQLELF